jgi:hypothetical protein
MLGAMSVDPRCIVAVVEFADERYVQFWVRSNGGVIAEVVSNLNIGDAVALSDQDEATLRAAGWSEPSPGPNPNWRYEADDVAGLLRIVSMSRDAVYDVLGERDGNTVSIRTWEMFDKHVSQSDLREQARIHFQESWREIRRQFDED